jgi:hypothetical protein
VYALQEVVNAESGDTLPDSVISESEWEYDDYEIVDGVHLRISGTHSEYGEVQQAFHLAYIESRETGEVIQEF